MSARLLLVEDEPDVGLIARAALARAGFDVIVAASGTEALQLVPAVRPDLVLLDWMLPDLSGPDTCTRLKGDPNTADVPVIFLTARRDEADLAQCAASGAIGCITKPFDPLRLGDQVRALWCEAGGQSARPQR